MPPFVQDVPVGTLRPFPSAVSTENNCDVLFAVVMIGIESLRGADAADFAKLYVSMSRGFPNLSQITFDAPADQPDGNHPWFLLCS